MHLRGALRARLLANATVSSLSGGRVYWGGRPQASSLPALVLTKAGNVEIWTHDGLNALIQPRVQIDAFASTSDAAENLIEAVKAEMQRLDAVTAGGWTFMPPAFLNIEIDHEPDDLDGGGRAYLISHDYSFWAQPAE
jgi:hypothetical protein